MLSQNSSIDGSSNLLEQDRKAFPFLRGEFPSGTSITIVMASDGATRRHAVALPSRCKRAKRTLMSHIRGTVPEECSAPRSTIARMQAHPRYNTSARGEVNRYFGWYAQLNINRTSHCARLCWRTLDPTVRLTSTCRRCTGSA